MNVVHAVMMYQTFYYVDTLGMAAAAFALAKTVKAVWDAVNDPMVGYLSDRTRTRLGRRRPWILAALPFYAISFMALFWVPPAFREGSALFWYLLAVVLIFETCDTIMQTNYDALFPELFRSTEERARAATIKNIFHLVAMVLGFALPSLLTEMVGFAGMAMIFTVILLITIPLMLMGSPEDPSASTARPTGLAVAFRETAKDRVFWIFTGVLVCLQTARGLLISGASLYSKYALGLDMMGTMAIFGGMYVVMMPMMHFWGKVARAWGLKPAWVASITTFALSTLVFAVAKGTVGAVAVGLCVGLGLSGTMMTGDLIMAWMIDRDAERTGQRREGIYYSVRQFYSKLAGALNAYAFVGLGLLFGYQGAESPGANPELAFRVLMTAVPFLAAAVALILARRMPYHEKSALAPQTLAA